MKAPIYSNLLHLFNLPKNSFNHLGYVQANGRFEARRFTFSNVGFN